jgi:acyl-CoA synthetase (NDP forming)
MTANPRAVYRHGDLVRFLEPKSIAIVGASPTPTSYSAFTQQNLRDFKGKVFLVNGKYEKIGAERCYPSIAALPEVPDSVVITIGRDSVEPVLRECAERRVGGVAIYAAGYGETGKPEGKALQERLVAIGRESGMRIVGPNVVGLINHVNKAAMSFSPDLTLSDQDGAAIGLISQSGGISNGLTQALQLGVRFSHTLSAGNSCDVDCADYLAYLAEDPHCRSIALVFEGLASIDRLMEAGELIVKTGKPLVVCKFGRGSAGAAAALSHTGFLAGSDAAYTAAFRRMNAIQVDNYHALIETAMLLAKAPPPKGRGIMVITASGGTAVYTADVAERLGIELPEPSAELKKKLAQHMPDFGTPSNPCDITAAAQTTERMFEAAEVAYQDPTYAAVLLPQMYVIDAQRGRIAGMGGAAARHGKMLAMTMMTEWMAGPGVREAHQHPSTAVFRDTEACLLALDGWIKRAERVKAGPRRYVRIADAGAARKAATLIDAAKNRTLTERESKDVLAAYGVPVVGEKLVQSADDAVAAAQSLGFPVVMKVESPELPHKTEAGVIRLNLKSDAEVKSAYDAVMGNANKALSKAPGGNGGAGGPPVPRINGVLVQPMVPSGAEIVIGAKIDPLFGPLIVVGLGGVMVELLKDSAVELAPVTKDEAAAMLKRLKGRKLIEGFRGSEPVDEAKLAELIVRLSEFASDQKDRIAELDVNPLICAGSRIVAVDALIVKQGDGAARC